MCLPIAAVAIAGVVASAAGTAMSVNSQMQQGKFQAQVAENNAKIAGYQADEAQKQGELQQDSINRRIAATAGAQRAAFAGAGISLGSGTTLDVAESSARTGASDIAMSQYNTALAKWGFGIQQQNAEAQASMDLATVNNAPISGAANFGASLLSTATQYKQQGIW
jgi:hypothetical protein